MRIEAEQPAHRPGIRRLALGAFPTAAEADLVDRLRHDGDVAISLVAVDGEEVVGHVLFSAMTAPMKALGLGPVAVEASRRGEGIASDLIREGLARARREGWQAVFVLGDPAFYARFGFSVEQAAGFETPYAGPYFMALALDGASLAHANDPVAYAPAFQSLE
ncbi:GNAT family N-acetyltransferase [Hyphomicrobium zavarzinii]|uniref:GNAT family N-acetyltransferase n=1 Tax=Hyphomicrobium zavarzinii TaxID=48292 RepID=UPI00037DDEE2|nr:N-acetyltransferase [Hyphomicrobium zavarzinii]